MTSRTRNIIVLIASGVMLFGMGIGAGMLIYRSSDRLVTVVSRELPDGTVYSGQMSHRRLEGRGLLVYPDGETYDGFFRHSRKHGFGVQRYADGSVYEGLWVHGERSGEGTLTTARGNVYSGQWHEDGLSSGSLRTEDFVYEGEFHKLSPHGFGVMDYPDGSWYSGNWDRGFKNGLGRLERPDTTFQFGVWEKGVLRDRGLGWRQESAVYGIDLSHHQPRIEWNELALYCDKTGRVGSRKARSTEYVRPVSFVFVKATQGVTIKDDKYHEFSSNARRMRIPVGSYHFLSLESDITSQVDSFASYATFEPGDLPPVLDVELSEAKVRDYGEDRLRDSVLLALRLIEDRFGVRPIVYSGDFFHRDHLSTDAFGAYDFWVARYGREPGTPHIIWQFTERGQLGGLPRFENVDIDVFRGDYRQFRRRFPVRRQF